MKELLLLALASFIGFWGGVMYAREVYRPLVDWYWKKARRENR